MNTDQPTDSRNQGASKKLSIGFLVAFLAVMAFLGGAAAYLVCRIHGQLCNPAPDTMSASAIESSPADRLTIQGIPLPTPNLPELKHTLDKPENQKLVQDILADPKFLKLCTGMAGAFMAKNQLSLLPVEEQGSGTGRQASLDMVLLRTNIVSFLSAMGEGDAADETGTIPRRKNDASIAALRDIIESPAGTSMLQVAIQVLNSLNRGNTNSASGTNIEKLLDAGDE